MKCLENTFLIGPFALNNISFLLFSSWCLSFPPWGGEKGHQETHNHLRQYMGGKWEILLKNHTIKTFALTSCKCLESTVNLAPPPSTQLHHASTFDHVREYA